MVERDTGAMPGVGIEAEELIDVVWTVRVLLDTLIVAYSVDQIRGAGCLSE